MSTITLAVRSIKAELKNTQATAAKLEQALTALNGHGRGGKRHLSAFARKRIAAAQRARWAKWHKAQRKAA